MTSRHPGVVLIVTAFAAATSSAQPPYPFQDPALDPEKRIESILSLMTLDEKIGALGTNSGVPRLQIPNAGNSEGLHGLVQRRAFGFGPQDPLPTTQFAQVVGMAQTWDRELVRRAGEVQGKEARWIYNNAAKYKRYPLVVWGPNADLARDPRWGRIDESYGEDAFLAGTMSAAFVDGMQGQDPKYWQAAALLKHFLANSNENGRYGSTGRRRRAPRQVPDRHQARAARPARDGALRQERVRRGALADGGAQGRRAAGGAREHRPPQERG
jgi:beta-glucosidase